MSDWPTRGRRARIAVALTALLVVGGASGCSGGDDTSSTTTSSSSTTVPIVEEAVPLTESYFTSLAQLPAASPGAPVAAVPGSDAANFARHQEAARRLLGLASPRTAEPALDGFSVCETDGGCSTYGGVVTDPATGRLTSFSVDGSPLTGRIVGSGPAVDRDGIAVEVRSAYVSVGGDLSVVLGVDNSSRFPVELFGFAAVLQPSEPSVSTASVEVAGAWGTATIEAGATGELMLMFASPTMGGVLELSGLRGDGLDVSFDVVVPTH